MKERNIKRKKKVLIEIKQHWEGKTSVQNPKTILVENMEDLRERSDFRSMR